MHNPKLVAHVLVHINGSHKLHALPLLFVIGNVGFILFVAKYNTSRLNVFPDSLHSEVGPIANEGIKGEHSLFDCFWIVVCFDPGEIRWNVASFETRLDARGPVNVKFVGRHEPLLQ